MSTLEDPRVLFAAERTLMAWNRTALALIGFGFAIERFGLFLAMLGQNDPGRPAVALQQGASLWIGVAFVVLGVASLGMAARQHRCILRSLNAKEIPAHYWSQAALVFNGAVAVLGLVLLVYMLTL